MPISRSLLVTLSMIVAESPILISNETPGYLALKEEASLGMMIFAGDGAGADDQLPGHPLAGSRQFILELAQVLEDGQGLGVEDLCLEGGHDRTAQAIEEFAVEPCLQVVDMLADRRLAGVQLFGGLGEASVLVNGDEYFQVSCFDGSGPQFKVYVGADA